MCLTLPVMHSQFLKPLKKCSCWFTGLNLDVASDICNQYSKNNYWLYTSYILITTLIQNPLRRSTWPETAGKTSNWPFTLALNEKVHMTKG